MELRITGLKEVRELLLNLDPKLKKEVGQKGTLELTKNLKRRIKNRYTRTGYGRGRSSGIGRNDMIITPTKKGAKLTIGEQAPWLILLEEGRSDHYVSPNTIKKHLRSPGSTMGKRIQDGQYGGKPIMWHWKGPFIKPAFETFRPQIPELLAKFVNKAIRKAGG